MEATFIIMDLADSQAQATHGDEPLSQTQSSFADDLSGEEEMRLESINEELGLLDEIQRLRRDRERLDAENKALKDRMSFRTGQSEEAIRQMIIDQMRSLSVKQPNEGSSRPTTQLEKRLDILLKNYPNTWV